MNSGLEKLWSSSPSVANSTTPIAVALSLYPIQEALVAHLQPDDLVTLTQVCQVIHGHVRMNEASAKANLLTKTLCPNWTDLRSHCPCATKDFHNSTQCGTVGGNVASHPCTACGINTCDECRIHVFYNALTEDPGIDEHRWWAGYFFLHPQPIAAYPPKNADSSTWHLPLEEMRPLNDQGRIHIPLDIPALGDPEPLSRILDLDLGCRRTVNPRGRTEHPYMGKQIISFLNAVIQERKEVKCSECTRAQKQQPVPPCSCTLRKHFLDRWLCIPCYVKEDEIAKARMKSLWVVHDDGHGHHHLCGCGKELGGSLSNSTVVCSWCNGEIVVDQDQDDDEHEEMTTEDDGAQNEEPVGEENFSMADFTDTPPDTYAFALNRDKSLTVYRDGTLTRGECIGRAVIWAWRSLEGLGVPCTCCSCNGRDPHADEENEWEDVSMSDSSDYADLPDLEEMSSSESEW